VRWQELYAACVSETETDGLEKLAYDTEGTMYLRLRELACEPRPSNEVQELKLAATGLLEIRIRKLGWPDPRFYAVAALDSTASASIAGFDSI
jgi:hypothetical protein